MAVGATSNGAVTGRQSAADRARQARIRLYRDRDARDARVEAAAAEAFGVADQLTAADDTLAAVKAAAAASIAAAAAEHRKATGKADGALSRVLGKLVAEKLAVSEIAELTSLSAADVRRLTKPAAGRSAARASSEPSGGPAAPGTGDEPATASPPAPGESVSAGDVAALAAAV